MVHSVTWQKQGPNDCAQTSASVLLAALGQPMSVEDIKKDVPVFINAKGEEIGTSWPHLAAFLKTKGNDVTMHATDIELLDRSWATLSPDEIIERLHERKKHIRHAYHGTDVIEAYVDGYEQFLKAGGRIVFPILTEGYLHQLLLKDPFIAAVSYNYLNSGPKKVFDQKKRQWSTDDISGRTTTHAVVVAGYDSGKFLIIDADQPSVEAGTRWLDAGHLIGAICLAETEWDNILITVG